MVDAMIVKGDLLTVKASTKLNFTRTSKLESLILFNRYTKDYKKLRVINTDTSTGFVQIACSTPDALAGQEVLTGGTDLRIRTSVLPSDSGSNWQALL